MVLSREDFMELIKRRVGDSTTDDDLKFMEDVVDTYNDLETRTRDSGEWERRYNENDAEWRRRYRERFFNGIDPSYTEIETETTEYIEGDVETVTEVKKETFEDLFE